MNKRDILNQIDSKKKELARLEVALRKLPELLLPINKG